MIVLEGQSALSHFRRARLESKLQSLVPEVRIRGAWHVYFVEAEAGATPDLATLRRVLQANEGDVPQAAGTVSRFVTRLLRLVSRRYSALIACSPSAASFGNEQLGRPCDETILNATDIDRWQVQARNRSPREQLLSVARWHPMKDHATLFEAVASLGEAPLLV